MSKNTFYRKVNFCIALSLLLYSYSFAQELSFLDAYNKMYQDNNSLKAIKTQNEAQQHVEKSLKGLRYPVLNAYATGLVFDKKMDLSFNNYRDGIAGILNIPNPSVLGDWEVPVAKKEMALAGFNAIWPVFTGGKINAAIKAGEIENNMADKEIVSTENRLISELAQRYFQVKLAEENLSIRIQVLEGMKKHLYNATKMEENGLIAPSEKLVANVAFSEANREVLAAEKDAKLARTALANTLEVDQVSENLTTPFFTKSIEGSLDSYKKSALLNNPELQKLTLQKDLANQGVKLKKASFYPDIALFGQTTLLHNNPIGFGILDSSRERPWMVGVGLTYNIFNGMRNKNELKAAVAIRKSIDFIEEKAQKDIETVVENMYFEIQKSQEEIENLNVQRELAEELLRSRNKAFAEGLATSTDVVDAENGLSLIKLLTLNAKYAYIVSLAGLLEFSGQSKDFLNYTN